DRSRPHPYSFVTGIMGIRRSADRLRIELQSGDCTQRGLPVFHNALLRLISRSERNPRPISRSASRTGLDLVPTNIIMVIMGIRRSGDRLRIQLQSRDYTQRGLPVFHNARLRLISRSERYLRPITRSE